MKEEVENHLRNAGLRVTRQRKEVLELLIKNSNTPLSIDEITAELSDGFDRVTTYRIINSFTEKGLVEKVNHLSNNLKVTLSPRLKNKHLHLVTCRVCGSTFTANICVQAGWKKKIEKMGFKDISHSLSFTGVCSAH